MPIINKTKRTADIYNRGREVVKVYDHGKLAWQKSTSIPDYLCFTALEQGRFTLSVSSYVTTTYLSYIEWSKNGRNWNRTTNENNGMTINVDVVQGDKVYWRGSGVTMTSLSAGADRGSIFSSTANFDASGHIMSLLQGGDFNDDALVNYSTSRIRNVTFARIFEDCEKLINAQDLVLPKFSSWYTYIFYQAFHNCTGLVTAPQLPTIEMSQSCFFGMFNGCTSLLEASDILATTAASECCRRMYVGCVSLTNTGNIAFTTLAANCCRQMYYGCSSITSASLLISTTLAENSCYEMFYNCSSLNYVKCLATDISANGCLTNWLYGVSSTGTFIQAEGVEWPRGASGIPTGWVDVEKRTMPQGYKQVLYVDNEHNDQPAGVSIGYPINMKYDTIEIAFQQDTISNGMPLQSAANVAGKAWFYNYLNSSMSSKPFSIYVNNESGGQRGMTVYQPLDTKPHVVHFAADGTYGTVTHNGTVVTTTYNVSDLPETCASNTILFGTLLYRGKILYFKNWDKDSNVLADYVPCVRESDGQVGFYDFASQSYKTKTQWIAGEEI